jgi:1-deoxy-D-xylulose-5-phosphate reductoisomerase
MGYPDMLVPIAYALNYPERLDVPVPTLNLASVGTLSFEPVDEEAFPALRLAREAALAGGTAPCTLNAANEVAVHAFLEERLGFLDIAEVIEGVLDRTGSAPLHSWDSLYEADRAARAAAAELVGARA